MISDQIGGTIAALAREYPVLGLALTTHRSTRGLALQFASRPFLVELYADARIMEQVAIRKAVQTGVSEWMLQVMLDAAGWRGRVSAYVLPSYKVRNRFVQSRVNPLLLQVPAYRDRCPGGAIGEDAKGGAENLALKRFGRGALMFLGSETETDFVEFSADLLIVDEYDSCNQRNVALAWNRLRESPFPQTIYVGNPSLPRQGISREYDESDRRRWFVRCDHCGERQNIDWFRNVVERDDAGRWIARDRKGWALGEVVRPCCVRCARPFDRTPEQALWVQETPSNPRRGYAMSRLDICDESLRQLVVEWLRAQGNPDLVRAFFNSVLGLGYEFEGSRLTVESLEHATAGQPDLDHDGGETYSAQVVTAGVDVGAVLHTTVSVVTRDPEGNPVRTARFVGACRSFSEVADVFRRYRVDVAVIDSMPETHKAQELRDTFVDEGGTMVWLCQFHPTARVGAQRYGMRLDYAAHVVQVDRTAVFDVSFEDIVGGRRSFPGDTWGVVGWSDQMRAPVRVVDPERARIIWTEGSAADHYRLSDVYDRVACDLVEVGGQYFGG